VYTCENSSCEKIVSSSSGSIEATPGQNQSTRLPPTARCRLVDAARMDIYAYT